MSKQIKFSQIKKSVDKHGTLRMSVGQSVVVVSSAEMLATAILVLKNVSKGSSIPPEILAAIEASLTAKPVRRGRPPGAKDSKPRKKKK